jgi:electron transfer flavoprotein alpha subunit
MIIVLVEHASGRPDDTSLQALALGHRVAGDVAVPLAAVLVGPGARDAAAATADHGVATAYVVEHEALAAYAPDAWAASLARIVETTSPRAVLAGGTDRSTEVLARTAARLDQPMAANCTDLRAGSGFDYTRQRWGGSLLEEGHIDGSPAFITVAPFAVAAAAAPVAAATPFRIEEVAPELADTDLRVRVVDRVERTPGSLALGDARVVVGGGRGVGSPEGFAILEELAELLSGTVGVSRVVTSAGWRPHEMQVGQTGTRIAPDLYVACGISGAIQHMVGCRSSKAILAINTDAEAPMVQRATYAVLGDLHAVIPAINAEIRRVTGAG